MADSGLPIVRPRGSGSLTVHLADELDVYFMKSPTAVRSGSSLRPMEAAHRRL